MEGHAKCLLLMTRGEGGGSKIPKTCLRNTWMFPYPESTKQMEQTLRAKVKIFFKSENFKKCC